MREKRVLLFTFFYVACLPMARPNCTSLSDGIDAYTLSAADGGLPAKCKVRLQSASDKKRLKWDFAKSIEFCISLDN
jgi:hypothetical protein